MILLIDNYDSFTFNLYQQVAALGPEVQVVRNDALTLTDIQTLDPSHIIISPGPGHPGVARDFGVCAEVVTELAPRGVPLLGVCLGHQGIVHHLGGRVVRAPAIVHGKTSLIEHDGQGLFAGLPRPMEVMRYHSLMADPETLPEALEVTARTADGLIMAIAHRHLPTFGVQFHPESIGTPQGTGLIANFLAMTTATARGAAR